MPKISVIITTFNRPEHLKETVASILKQTFRDFELIVTDNYSNYDFFELINNFNDHRIRPFQNKNNGIIAVNRNFGIKMATGDYIAFCDDDDLWLPEKLEKQLKIMESDKEIGASYVLYSFLIDNKVLAKKYPRPKRRFNGWIFKDLYLANMMLYSGIMVRKDVIADVGLFDSDPRIIAAEDYDMGLRISLKYPVKCVPDVLVLCRISSNSMLRQFGILRLGLILANRYRKHAGAWLFFRRISILLVFHSYFVNLLRDLYYRISIALTHRRARRSGLAQDSPSGASMGRA